jgi:hypothetical protein
METAEMRFLRTTTGYKTADNKRNEDIRDELETTDMNTVMKMIEFIIIIMNIIKV